MPKLPAISGKKLVQILERSGFVVKRSSSSHFLLEHADGRVTTIPLHANKDLPKGTLKAILRDIEITNDQLQKLL
ncbi:MAG: hypothetical protein A2836_01040 [Candidatus Taylorbacteria bacterium RIFCSPHIGHO2_01_FULL_45_63]|uniref:Addiction module toxin, HicA family n=1 Tax=Candidatus Taylorbacteria bacterium RIFCSPHIGHO2_02_FULL_45_35 TaxID=1802311 RepID=A0A1G2MS99_9BACT|nr:MAG: hypothetical protein A2836_01040 [Candidatus Taylorbacteria bacterium RIFCSPHIGHO2_01_FULL_45_63]OHA25881.1 MAG: hypothetical protein A3D56_01810 [Candidatus Taylorbacteria bacterium RIFCSPHIGHO2_02_FULL_45_35]OHA32370.1 MAG: hypothetical protein A3A22_03635 [Candidatus Taylorbacteria bacterium RIFCSPLOWO2_01_FULL_45_34b]